MTHSRLIAFAALPLVVCLFSLIAAGADEKTDDPAATPPDGIRIEKDSEQGILRVLIGKLEAFVYRFGPEEDLTHFFPVRSPSGKSMTVQHPDPYPHHRSFWFADRVQLKGKRAVSFYNALYSRKKDQKEPGYPDRIRHVKFHTCEASGKTARLREELAWEMDGSTRVLDEQRDMRVVALGEGEYFLDITFTVKASHGDVAFVSDDVHYAWPYIRMNKKFNVDAGGTITNSEGQVNQKGTHNQVATWMDYSSPVDGVVEGLTLFSHPDNPQPRRWLSRDYGCFGPRRIDARSGKKFTLSKGDSLKCRIGVLVHRGDVRGGRVAERYRAYCKGEL